MKAFVFPGQGSQKKGMGKDAYENFEESKRVFQKAAKVLGFDIASLCFEGTEEKLKLTEYAQPAILTTSIALLYGLNKLPDAAFGHSLGEYSALVCASSISFEDAVRTVHLRGKFMQSAVPIGKGKMSAILGFEKNKLLDCLKSASSMGIVEVANYNSPNQIVISGEIKAVEEAEKICKENGAKRIISLEVSAPFHSSLMKDAANNLKKELNKIKISDTKINFISNVTATFINSGNEIKNLLVEQMYMPVLWEDSCRYAYNNGINTFVEIGNGTVLSGLIKKILEHVTMYNVQDARSAVSYKW